MPTDKELDQATADLANLRTSSELHYESLAGLLQKYATLVDDYKRLRSDYEEERDSRERYKQMARGQERNPFVLVLIDGDGYVFDDDLISNGAEGGQKAAGLLNEMVKNSLRARGLDHCRILVRVYANLAGLSKALSKVKLAGPEKRSLAPFVANFNRSNDLFDFVDTGELKENADFKIRAMFRQFAENAQCRHIYFACCHDVGYLSELTPYINNRDRITLVRTPAFHQEFSKLGMRIEDFPNIFRTTPLEGQSFVPSIKTPPPRSVEPSTATAADNTATVCSFYQKGVCKCGKACRNLHVKASTNGSPLETSSNLPDTRDWRINNSGGKSGIPFQMPHVSKNDNDFMSGNNISNNPLQLQIDLAIMLPKSEDVPRNEIPINSNQHRLDVYIPPPSLEERTAFQHRIAVQKLCNNHHIQGNCPKLDNCEFDHSPVSQAMLNCLKQVVRNMPCPRKGGCRSLSCLNGHICQKVDCKWRGGKQFCKFGMQAHCQILEVAEFVQATGLKDDVDTGAANWDGSSKSSSSPIGKPRGLHDESDVEQEFEEGALLDRGEGVAAN